MAAKHKTQKQIPKTHTTGSDVESSTRPSGAPGSGSVRVLLPSDPATRDPGKVRIGGVVTWAPSEE